MKIEEVVKAAATITAGIMANPCSGAMFTAQFSDYGRQQLIEGVLQDTMQALSVKGVSIEYGDEQ